MPPEDSLCLLRLTLQTRAAFCRNRQRAFHLQNVPQHQRCNSEVLD